MSHEHDQRPDPLTFEQIAESAKEHLLAKGSHPPLLVLEGDADTVGIELDFPKTSERRQELLYVVGLGVARTGVVGALRQVFLVSEAWMSTPDDLDSNFRPPAEDPQRREILLIMSRRPEASLMRVVALEMRRDSEGAVRELNEITPEVSDNTNAVSPLLNAFVAGYTQGRASLT